MYKEPKVLTYGNTTKAFYAMQLQLISLRKVFVPTRHQRSCFKALRFRTADMLSCHSSSLFICFTKLNNNATSSEHPARSLSPPAKPRSFTAKPLSHRPLTQDSCRGALRAHALGVVSGVHFRRTKLSFSLTQSRPICTEQYPRYKNMAVLWSFPGCFLVCLLAPFLASAPSPALPIARHSQPI